MATNLGELRDLYQQTILERYKKPKFRGRTESVDLTSRGHNPSCGDTIELTVQLDGAGETVAAVRFEGEGCAIALSSADLMAEALIGKSLDEALTMVRQFQGMMKGEGEFPHAQRKLNVMKGVAAFPVRIKCANLAWHTLRAAIENPVGTTSSGFISTESEG